MTFNFSVGNPHSMGEKIRNENDPSFVFVVSKYRVFASGAFQSRFGEINSLRRTVSMLLGCIDWVLLFTSKIRLLFEQLRNKNIVKSNKPL